MTDFKHLLDQAADDEGHPVRTDLGDLLDRAQRGRRRQRARTWGAAVALTAAVAVAAPLAVTNLRFGGATPSPAELAPAAGSASASTTPTSVPPTTTPATTPPTTAAVATGLEPTEILARCQPQMAKFDRLGRGEPTVAWDEWKVLHPERGYAPGDMVALGQTSTPFSVNRPCLIPEAGHENDPVSFDDLEPSAAVALGQRCSLEMDSSRGSSIDVRGAKVLASMSRGGVTAAVLEKDGKRYSCTLDPVIWRSGGGGATPVRAADSEFLLENTTINIKPNANVKQPAAAFYYGAGLVSEKAASITVTVTGHAPARFPVTQGRYALVLHLVGEEGLKNFTATVNDAQGKVLAEQRMTETS